MNFNYKSFMETAKTIIENNKNVIIVSLLYPWLVE